MGLLGRFTLMNIRNSANASSRDFKDMYDVLNGHFNGVWDVSQFGAKGDGFTNDHTAIQAAIDAAYTYGGGVVYLPKGTFCVGTYLSINDKITLRGAGRDLTTIKALSGITTAVIVGLQSQAVARAEIRDISIDGSSEDVSGNVSGIQVTEGSYIKVRNVRVFNTRDRGILLNNCPDSEVENCFIENVGQGGVNGHGIEIVNGSHRAKVRDNRLFCASDTGMGIRIGADGDGSEYCEIVGNFIDQINSGLECIGVTPDCIGSIVANNQAINGQDNGISVSADDCTVTGNYSSNAQFHGIQINGNNSVVTGNVSKNNGQNASETRGGIHLNNTTGVVVTGNRCYDDQEVKTQEYGIKGSGEEGVCLITVNNLIGNATDGVGNLSENVVLANNLGIA